VCFYLYCNADMVLDLKKIGYLFICSDFLVNFLMDLIYDISVYLQLQGGNVAHLHKLLSIESSSQVQHYLPFKFLFFILYTFLRQRWETTDGLTI